MIDQLMIFSFQSIHTISVKPLPTSTPEPLCLPAIFIKDRRHLFRLLFGRASRSFSFLLMSSPQSDCIPRGLCCSPDCGVLRIVGVWVWVFLMLMRVLCLKGEPITIARGAYLLCLWVSLDFAGNICFCCQERKRS
ncbi:Transposase [Fusarium oxysporum f. sp. albedinis]|nr:Transposase [Fusarium oxysporum f. sp. albedinis]